MHGYLEDIYWSNYRRLRSKRRAMTAAEWAEFRDFARLGALALVRNIAARAQTPLSPQAGSFE